MPRFLSYFVSLYVNSVKFGHFHLIIIYIIVLKFMVGWGCCLPLGSYFYDFLKKSDGLDWVAIAKKAIENF